MSTETAETAPRLDWFKSWHGAPTDMKYLVIGRKAGVAPGIVSAIVWALLDRASTARNRGSVEGFDVETYAAFSGFEEDQIEAVIEALEAKGVLQGGRFTQWDKHQSKTNGDSKERTQLYRARKKAEELQAQLDALRAQAKAGEQEKQPEAQENSPYSDDLKQSVTECDVREDKSRVEYIYTTQSENTPEVDPDDPWSFAEATPQPPQAPATPPKKPKAQATEKPDPLKPLRDQLRDGFLSKQPGRRFKNYAKENKILKDLVALAAQIKPEDPGGYIAPLIAKYAELCQTGTTFWQGQPFTPAGLSTTWDRLTALVYGHGNLEDQEAQREDKERYVALAVGAMREAGGRRAVGGRP